jgi:hypothetical protein
MSFFSEYKKQIIVSFFVLVVVLIIYFYGKKKGTVKQIPLPKDNQNLQGEGVTTTGTDRIRETAEMLYNDMKGLNVISRNAEPYNRLLSASDTFVVAVYNEFNKLYFKQSKQTLTQWIRGENFFWTQGTFFKEAPPAQAKDIILARFSRLNLP